MAPLNGLQVAERALESTPQPSISPLASVMRSLFFGPGGLRAGWQILIFVPLAVLLFGGVVLIRSGGPQGLRHAYKHMGQVVMTPFLMGVSDAISFSILCLPTPAMGRIEHRKFGEFCLPLRQALDKNFWVGCLSWPRFSAATIVKIAIQCREFARRRARLCGGFVTFFYLMSFEYSVHGFIR
jgi:hypothetical protein